VIGRPYGYGQEEIATLKRMIMYHVAPYNYPVLYNVNIGHTSPILTIPLGSHTRLNAATDTFAMLEAGVL